MSGDVIRVLLKKWVVADGECSVPSVGDVITVGLGLDVDGADRGRTAPDGIVSTASSASVSSRRSAGVVLTGQLHDVLDADGSPSARVVTPAEGVHVVLLGEPAMSGSGSRVTVRGTLVVEPYMWGEPGLIASDERFAPTTASVRAVHLIDPESRRPAGLACDVLLDLVPMT